MRSARAIFCFLLFAVFFLVLSLSYGLLFPKQSFAQTTPSHQNNTAPVETFRSPNVDPDVPRNQHTYAQTTTIEVLSAVYCILTGIDPIDPTLGCVDINPETRKLGVSKPAVDRYGRTEIAGLLGATSGLIGSTYEPIASTGTFTQYLSENFGIVKKAHAAEPCNPKTLGYGFCGLQPILKLWEAVRNIAYALLTIAFIFIGIGVMLRVKIDPRTVMSLQNQIPRVIVSIILITLSYGIAALMIDTMWVTTYAGTYLLTAHRDPAVGDCTEKDPSKREKLSEKATTTILQSPFTYFNQIFARCSNENNLSGLTQNDRDGGFHVLSRDVSNNVGQTVGNVARSLMFDEDDLKTKCGLGGSIMHPIKCAKKGVVNVLVGIVSLVVLIVIFVILVVTMFRIWFALLKAYIYALIYIIVGPIYIVFGLLPSKPLGFEKWLRGVFVNVAIFPLTAYVFVIARLLMDLYDNSFPDQFVPPLIGNPSSTNFGALMAFGVLLLGPSIQTILREKMGVKGIGSPGLIAGAISGGAGMVGGPVSRAYKHLNRHDNSGHAVGAMAVGKDKAGDWALNKASTARINPFKAATKRRLEERHAVKGRNAYESEGLKRREIREAYRNPKHKFWESDQGKDIIAKNGGEIPLSWRGERKINGHGGEGGTGGDRAGKRYRLRPWKRRPGPGDEGTAASGDHVPPVPPTGGAGGAVETTATGEKHTGAGESTKASVLNVEAGTVNMKGGEKSKSFVNQKVDEYIKRLSDDGRKATATAKQGKIEVRIQDALKNKDHEEIEEMARGHELEELIKKQHEEVEKEK